MLKNAFPFAFHLAIFWCVHRASQVVLVVKNLSASAWDTKDLSSSPGSGRSPEKGMAIHSSIFAWRIPWTEEPGGLQSIESQRVGHDWATNASSFTWRVHAHWYFWSSQQPHWGRQDRHCYIHFPFYKYRSCGTKDAEWLTRYHILDPQLQMASLSFLPW